MHNLIYSLIGIAVAMCVSIIIYDLIDRERIKEEARKHKNRNELLAKITATIRNNDYHLVRVGLLDSSHNITQEIEIKGKEVDNDLYVGEILTLDN